jgi:hypothetical protein
MKNAQNNSGILSFENKKIPEKKFRDSIFIIMN